MNNDANLILSETDFKKISALLVLNQSDIFELLEEELHRALVVSTEMLPKDVVAMNSTVTFLDMDSNRQSVVELVYPHQVDIEKNKISILSPIGAALIGLRVQQSIHWPMPSGKVKKLKVVSVHENREVVDE